MTPEHWQQVKAIFAESLSVPADERAAFLKQACAGTPELRFEVEALLAAHQEAEAGDLYTSPVESEASPEDERIGPYQLIRKLGQGGMGTVYLAERADKAFYKKVALKLVRYGLDTTDLFNRFLYEREILAALDHPNIARLLDGGTTDDGRPYFVMEYVEGEPVNEYCERRHLSTRQRLALFRTVCRAVAFAHRNLVVHRDLKPSNILVTEDGEVKLLDFGIAKLLKEEAVDRTAPQTRTGLRLLTPEYASPEQVRGESVTTSSDVYQLGVLLYELLTGQRPFMIDSRMAREVERVILEEEPTRPSTALTRPGTQAQLKRELAGDLDNITLKALRKEPERRYGSVEGLSEDVRRHLAGLPVEARADTLGYRVSKFVQRHRVGVSSAALVVLALMLGLAGTAWQAREAMQARDRAQAEAAKAEQINGFLQDMLAAPHPEQEGRAVTVAEVLDSAAARVQTAFADQPEVDAALQHTIGRTYHGLGLYEEAERHLKKAIDVQRQYVGEEDEGTLLSMNDYALLLVSQSRYDEAIPLLRTVIETRRRRFAENRGEFAVVLNNLAYALDDLGHYAEADSLYQEALTIERAQPEAEVDQGFVSQVLNNLATVRHFTGRYEEAEQTYREALALRMRVVGEEDLNVARIYNNIGALLYAQEQYDSAAVYYEKALGLRRILLGEEHPTTALTLHNLGNLLRAKGDLDEAEALLEDVLQIRRRILGNENQGVGYTLVALGLLRIQQERPEQGEQHLREAVRIFTDAFSEAHWLVGYAEGVLGRSLAAQQRYPEAEQVLLRGLPKVEAGLGAEHTRAQDLKRYLADLYEAWGKPDQAAAYQ